jgi:succinate-semialdehyde dehydrogenase / glutarate-semialdehyde dehydrogenase
MPIISNNPATGKLIKQYDVITEQEINKKLEKANLSFKKWKNISFDQRSQIFLSVAQNLENNKQTYAKVITSEMGKTLQSAIAEVEKCAWVCRHYAEYTEKYLKPEIIDTEAKKSMVVFEPLGVILEIMPWNFPFWQVFRVSAPILMSGNVAVLKHASNVPQSALLIEQIFTEAGLPDGVFQTLLIDSSQVENIIKNDIVQAVTLTGSEKAGSTVASIAGSQIKKIVMELGGSDPFIVLEDADIDYVVEKAVIARLQNNGQSCIASKRFIVAKNIFQEFEYKLKAKFAEVVVGDPMDQQTLLGPLVSQSAVDEIANQVDESVKLGARIVIGGKKVSREGYFYEPTILADVKPGMPAFDQELFGPVLAMIEAESEDEMIKLTNNHRYGLGATIWTTDIDKALDMAKYIEAGSVFINDITKSHPLLPVGGIKKSGYGRELGSYGIKEFMNIKTIWVN